MIVDLGLRPDGYWAMEDGVLIKFPTEEEFIQYKKEKED